jgi:hypothetical protein
VTSARPAAAERDVDELVVHAVESANASLCFSTTRRALGDDLAHPHRAGSASTGSARRSASVSTSPASAGAPRPGGRPAPRCPWSPQPLDEGTAVGASAGGARPEDDEDVGAGERQRVGGGRRPPCSGRRGRGHPPRRRPPSPRGRAAAAPRPGSGPCAPASWAARRGSRSPAPPLPTGDGGTKPCPHPTWGGRGGFTLGHDTNFLSCRCTRHTTAPCQECLDLPSHSWRHPPYLGVRRAA